MTNLIDITNATDADLDALLGACDAHAGHLTDGKAEAAAIRAALADADAKAALGIVDHSPYARNFVVQAHTIKTCMVSLPTYTEIEIEHIGLPAKGAARAKALAWVRSVAESHAAGVVVRIAN